jgi:hypothetical protein
MLLGHERVNENRWLNCLWNLIPFMFIVCGLVSSNDQSNYVEMIEFRRTASIIWHYHGECIVGRVVDSHFMVLELILLELWITLFLVFLPCHTNDAWKMRVIRVQLIFFYSLMIWCLVAILFCCSNIIHDYIFLFNDTPSVSFYKRQFTF